jgi:hypothetical protein
LTVSLDLSSGAVLWARESPIALENLPRGQNSPASCTPATDGEGVVAFFGSFGLPAYDNAGALLWAHPLGPFRTPYGMGTSPINAGVGVLSPCDQDGDSFLLALDRESGEQRWRTPRPEAKHGFSTPILYHPAEREVRVIVSGSSRLSAYSLSNCARAWWLDGMAWPAKSVPVLHADRLFVNSWMASPSTLGVPEVKSPFEEALAEHDDDGDGLSSEAETTQLGLSVLSFLADLDESGALDCGEWDLLPARGVARNGLHAVQLPGRGALGESDVPWNLRRSLPNIPSPLFYHGLLYVLKEGGIMSVIDPLDGKVLQAARIEGAVDTRHASPVAAEGKLLCASHRGRLTLSEDDRQILEWPAGRDAARARGVRLSAADRLGRVRPARSRRSRALASARTRWHRRELRRLRNAEGGPGPADCGQAGCGSWGRADRAGRRGARSAPPRRSSRRRCSRWGVQRSSRCPRPSLHRDDRWRPGGG